MQYLNLEISTIIDAERVEVFLIVIEKHYEDLNKFLEAYNIPPGFFLMSAKKALLIPLTLK